jgi:leader peptidase (prepilin peptidase)/N-methyltransferase
MGEGDIDIALICGLFLGIKGVILTLFLAFVLGGAIAVVLLILKVKDRKDEIAFGPYLAIGGIVSALFGQELINIYINMFLK